MERVAEVVDLGLCLGIGLRLESCLEHPFSADGIFTNGTTVDFSEPTSFSSFAILSFNILISESNCCGGWLRLAD